jgi:hypothetical protein
MFEQTYHFIVDMLSRESLLRNPGCTGNLPMESPIFHSQLLENLGYRLIHVDVIAAVHDTATTCGRIHFLGTASKHIEST